MLDYGKDRAFRLRFQNETGGVDDYLSEVYHPQKGERTKRAAYEVCVRYGWDKFPPSTGMLTEERLHELKRMVQEAICEFDRHPERFVPDPEKFWDGIFGDNMDSGEFHWEMCPTGDPPIPSEDCDYEGGWTAYNYDQEYTRVIPYGARSASITEGPRGLEIIEFHSGDRDGNWETDEIFARMPEGLELTPRDKRRIKASRKRVDAASTAFYRASRDDEGWESIKEEYWAAKKEWEIVGKLEELDFYKECWDPEMFAYAAAKMNCYWSCLRYSLYNIDCAIEGKDPLGNIHPQREDVSGTFDVTAKIRKGTTEYEAVLVRGDADLEEKAIGYMDGHTVAEIKEILKEHPKGRPFRKERASYGLTMGWTPRGVTVSSVTFRVKVAGRRDVPLTEKRIRQVSCKGLEEDVLRMIHTMDKLYPKS